MVKTNLNVTKEQMKQIIIDFGHLSVDLTTGGHQERDESDKLPTFWKLKPPK